MKKTLLFAALAIAAQTAVAANVAKADKDNDGTLDKNEAKAIPMVAKHFDAIDLDKDGTVDQAEIDAFKIMAARSTRKKSSTRASQKRLMNSTATKMARWTLRKSLASFKRRADTQHREYRSSEYAPSGAFFI
jgi:hypothetical protein